MEKTARIFNAALESCAALSPGVFRLRLAAPGPFAPRPCQFVNLAVPGPTGRDPLLRRPFSVHRLHPPAGGRIAFEILFKKVGAGTRVLAGLAPGTELSVLGPLGRGFDAGGKAPGGSLLVAGGMGLAPLPFLAAELLARSKDPVLLYGFTGKFAVPLEAFPSDPALALPGAGMRPQGLAGLKKAAAACEEPRPGLFHGTAVDLLEAFLAGRPPADLEIFACGPAGMLKRVDEIALARGIPAQILLEERMACGFGACQSCVCRVHLAGGETGWKKVCLDGPVFRAGEVAW